MTSKEAFKMIKIKCHPNANPSPMIDEALNKIEKELERLEKQDKILEILKRTKNLQVYFFDNGKRNYVLSFDRTRNQRISKEEYDLLKEWLEND